MDGQKREELERKQGDIGWEMATSIGRSIQHCAATYLASTQLVGALQGKKIM